MVQILEIKDKYKIVGEIYKITNVLNGKSYIGQTRSHRLNHGKYRPFGSLGRFKDHISEANSNKKNQSRCLNNAILKHGKEAFICQLVQTCELNMLDELEKCYIAYYDSKFPKGYNLTDGGRGFVDISGNYIWNVNSSKPQIHKKSHTKTDYTRALISKRLKSHYNDKSCCVEKMKLTQQQHLTTKFERLKHIVFNDDNLDKYIRVIKNNTNNTEYVRIVVENKRITTFVGKHETIDEIKTRAKKFILDLKEWQRSQIAGNSLEPKTTTSRWKHYEGTRLIAVANGKNVLGLDNPQPSS